ncbi:MAG TPA: hypothetical protein VG276_12785 [Actinomycetes bacterium]|jgi:hypothetical protein|nr:hypothetical protein [Actinomycetes bacterium]
MARVAHLGRRAPQLAGLLADAHRGCQLQDEVVVAVRLAVPGPVVDGSERLDYEQEAYFAFRWWPVAEVAGSGARFYPGRLPTLLRVFLGGEEIDEPFELWS